MNRLIAPLMLGMLFTACNKNPLENGLTPEHEAQIREMTLAKINKVETYTPENFEAVQKEDLDGMVVAMKVASPRYLACSNSFLCFAKAACASL